MRFHPDVLAAHAQFGGDLEDMQRRYDAASPSAERMVERLKWTAQTEPEPTRSAVSTDAADLIQSLSSQLAEARAEIERLTPLAVAYDYLESPAGREMAEADRDRLAAENERLREALTPSGETKAAYIGEFYERIEIANPEFDDDDLAPETIMHPFMVSWTTIKEIMAAISARAALEPGEALDPEDFPTQALAGAPISEICPGCDGSGEYTDWGGVCPTCGGTGGVRTLTDGGHDV